MARTAGVNGETEAQAPGARVVKALGNDTAATFVATAVTMARAAFKEQLEARTFPDGKPTGLTPIETKMLDILDSHADQLLEATTVPAGSPS